MATELKKKNFRVRREIRTLTEDFVAVSAVDKYEAQRIAEENADELTWSEPTTYDSECEVDFSAQEIDENGETETDRMRRDVAAILQAPETK